MSLGACRLNRRILVPVVVLWASLSFISCGGSAKTGSTSGLLNRVLASQGVTATFASGGLVVIDGQNDTLAQVGRLSAGSSPDLMAISPTRNIVAAFDASSNNVFTVDTARETGIGNVQLPGPTSSMVFPTANAIGYAAIPTATVNGFSVLGAVDVMNFSTSGLTTIAVSKAQTVVADSTGTQLLVFSNDSDSVTVLSPGLAAPPVDTSCLSNPTNVAVCTIVPGFDRPVNAVINGSTAYILNCGAECGGVQASVQTLDLSTFAVGTPIKVNGATIGLLNGSRLYVAGNGTPTGPLCASITPAPTAATYCGTLDIVDLSTLTDPYFNSPSTEIAITDGYHDRIDMTVNGQIFIGSHDCTNIGNVNNPSGEVRGCLAIFHTADNSVIFPPDNGDVNGLQGFTSRNIEYVAEGGSLRVYDTTKDILLINDFVPQGSINIVGYVGDVKAIDFF
jgi:hypothetical protein